MQKSIIVIFIVFFFLSSAFADDKAGEEIYTQSLQEIKKAMNFKTAVIAEMTEGNVNGIPLKDLIFRELDMKHPDLYEKFLNESKKEKVIINSSNDTIVPNESILPEVSSGGFSWKEIRENFSDFDTIIYFSHISFLDNQALVLVNNLMFGPYGEGYFYIFEKKGDGWYLIDSLHAYK